MQINALSGIPIDSAAFFMRSYSGIGILKSFSFVIAVLL